MSDREVLGFYHKMFANLPEGFRPENNTEDWALARAHEAMFHYYQDRADGVEYTGDASPTPTEILISDDLTTEDVLRMAREDNE